MKNILLLGAVLFALTSFAQEDCSKEILAQKSGTWKVGMKGSIAGVTAADLVKEKAVLASIHKMISSNYSPVGCELNYSTVFGKYPLEGQVYKADPYYYSMYILRYLCDQNSADKSKYYVDISTPTTVNIVANSIPFLSILYATNLPADHFRGYLLLEERPIKKDGYYFSKEKISYNEEIWEYRWLITYNDTLPFTYLTRKEYLLIQKKRLEKSVSESPGSEKYAQKYFDRINEFLSRSEDELSKDAICMWNDEERFEGFVEEGTRGSFIAVKPNLAYYKKNLPKSSPQFFTVVYKIAQGDPVFDANIAAIKEAVDFAKLRGMLGK
ncbi:MAG: hypothetical protein Q7U54_20530 [Bacteroidales bacterium]|nr:hypothetical protein [Bacteroidales bacterium]